MTLNKFDTLEDMYHYTNEQKFETVYSKSKGSWFEKEYPCIIVVRSQTALDEYPNEPWYNPSYDFSKGFLVALQLNADNSEGYKVTSVWKQDGKFVFTIARCTADEEMSMGEWDIALRFDKHTKINTPEDIVLKFI